MIQSTEDNNKMTLEETIERYRYNPPIGDSIDALIAELGDIRFSQVSDLFIMVFPEEDSELIERAVNDPSVNHYKGVPIEHFAARLLTLRYADELPHRTIVKRMGFKSENFSSHYCLKAHKTFLKRFSKMRNEK